MKNQVAIVKLTFRVQTTLKVNYYFTFRNKKVYIIYNITDIDKNCKCVSVVLSAGDVLLVPHKWWHYVENLTTAISINTWIPIPKYDNMARLNESVVRFMASSICNGVSENIRLQLLNPNEVIENY